MENKQRHLEFIQNVISRMAQNSFLLKGWAITLIAALFAVFSSNLNKIYISIAYFPILMFWALDAYYLSQERRFRALYDIIRQRQESEIDFSMDTSQLSCAKNDWGKSLLSKTLSLFYLMLLGIMLFIEYFLC